MNLRNPFTNAFTLVKNEWMKRPLFYPIFIFTAIFFFSRLVIFFIPYVEISYDSILYVNYIDKYIAKNILPPIDFIPLGYPIVLKLLSVFHNSVYSIVFFQTFITWFSSVLIINATEKKYPLQSIWVVIPLCIFVLSAKNIYYDISLSSESLYVSSFLIVIAFIILSLNSLKKRYWIGLSISLFFPMFFRPNGVITIVLFLIILLYCVLIIKKTAIIISFASPYLMLLILLSSYSLIASKSFTITSPSRMKQELKTQQGMNEGEQIQFGVECLCLEKPSFRKAIKQYYFFKGFHSLNPKLKNIYIKYHDYNWPINLNMGTQESINYVEMNKGFSENDKRNTFKEFYAKSYVESVEKKAIQYRKTIAFKSYDWYQLKIHKPIFASLLWPVIFFISFVVGVFQFLRSKFKSTDYLIFILLCALNIGTNLIHVITTHRTLARYEYPGEFLYYLAPFFLIICFKNAKK